MERYCAICFKEGINCRSFTDYYESKPHTRFICDNCYGQFKAEYNYKKVDPELEPIESRFEILDL